MSTIKVDPIATRTGSGNITSSNTIDLNGNELILDVDGDTSLTADTDDQIDIRIGGTDVGTLTQNSGKLTINSSGTNLSFAVGGTVELNTDGTQFYPQTDNSHNLGTASLRFKDLYLSSGVFLGGTGAANELDDYEEGTWTPTAGTNAGTINTAVGKYTKIGRVVYIVAYIESTGQSTNANKTYGGLPFAVNNLASQTSVDYQGLVWENNSAGGIYFEGGTTNMVNNYLNTFRGSFTASDNSRFQGFYFTD